MAIRALTVVNEDTRDDVVVVKLARSDGVAVWRRDIDGGAGDLDVARSVAADSVGDLFIVGDLVQQGSGRDFVTIKLSGSDGSELWRSSIRGTADGIDVGTRVVVDTAGNAVAIGTVDNLGTSLDIAVVKLSGVTGATLWRKEIQGQFADRGRRNGRRD